MSTLGDSRWHRLLRAFTLCYLCHLCCFISYCTVTLVCQFSFKHMYFTYVLAIDEFTIFWWVVNLSIVVILYMHFQVINLLSYLWWGETILFHIMLLYCILPLVGWLLIIILLLLFLLLYYSRAKFPCISFIVWGPRVCQHEET